MSLTDQASFFISKEPQRNHYSTTIEKLLNKIKQDRATRHSTLAGKDIKLLRTVEAAVTYIHSIYDNEWRICLSNEVIEYIDRMQECLNSYLIHDEEFTGDKFYLSICDVEIILKETNDIIYYLRVEFDPSVYSMKKSAFLKLKNYFFEAFPGLKKNRFQIQKKQYHIAMDEVKNL